MAELILDRYRPLALIGSGGQADVVVAFDEQMKRRVAIKTVELDAFASQASALEEARTAAMLNHPNIATMYDFAVEAGRAYLIMEYVDGVDVNDIASEDLTDEIIAAVARDVGDALAFAHKNGVLHLDIKPANLVVDHEGRVKIIDFGVSALSQATGSPTAAAGTIGYMPIEQLAGAAVGPATDEWAYAAVIYELLSDEFPYEEAYLQAQRVPRRSHVPDPLTLMRTIQAQGEPELLLTGNDELDAVLAKALSRDPSERFETVRKLKAALAKTLPPPKSGRTQLARLVGTVTDDDVEYALEQVERARPRPFAGCFAVLAIGLVTVGALVTAVANAVG